MKVWQRFLQWRADRNQELYDRHEDIMKELRVRQLILQKRAEALSHHAVELYRLVRTEPNRGRI